MPQLHDPGLDSDDDERYEDEESLLDFDDDPEVEQPSGLLGCHGRRQSLRNFLQTRSHEDIAARIARIIDHMVDNEAMDLANLLYYISWNLDVDKTSDDYRKIQYARTALMHSELLGPTLARWYQPPRQHGKGLRTKAAREVMEQWAEENVKMRMNREMKQLIPYTLSPPEELSEENLLSFSLSKMRTDYETHAPLTWRLVFAAASTPLQLKRSKKEHTASVCMIISMLSFNRSHHRCYFQKYLSVFLASSSLSAKAADALHALGVTMRQKFKYTALELLSDAKHKAMEHDVLVSRKPMVATYDNINLAFKKVEQRLDNQSHFDSGCAATIYVIENPDLPQPDARAFQEQWQRECKNPIDAFEIMDMDLEAADRLFAFDKWRVLDILLNSPQFDREKYSESNHHIFDPPSAVLQLPTGLRHLLTQYILDTSHIEEVSLEGNLRCIEEWYRQLRLGTDDAQRDLVQDLLWFWMGDQLTVSRIRGLQILRAKELNGWHRMERIKAFFAWLHAQMALEESIHKQHFATGIGGLKQAFDLLKRKGLHSTSVAGNFHQRVREAYAHILEAHICDIWEVVGEVKSLAELRGKSAQELDRLADKIINEYSSTFAYTKHSEKTAADQDHVFMNQILLTRDLLLYANLDHAMHTGDVGRIKDLLPRLLYRYHGGKNWKYVVEVLELIQGLLREWPEDFSKYVLRYCWLAVTNDGKSFQPYDMLQERNVRDIKSTFAVHGPYASWEYIKRISAAIPTLRKVKDHTEIEINHFFRGKSHTSPAKAKDVARLQESYKNSKIHVYTAGRHLISARRAKDYLDIGSNPIQLQGTIDRWAARRLTSRSTQEIWEDIAEEDSTNTEETDAMQID